MKLKQILSEQNVSEEQIREFADRVKQDCSQYLRNKSPETNLYRGASRGKEAMVINQDVAAAIGAGSEIAIYAPQGFHMLRYDIYRHFQGQFEALLDD